MKKFFYSLFHKSDFFKTVISAVSDRLYIDMQFVHFQCCISSLEERLSLLECKDFLLSESFYILELSPKHFDYLKYIADDFHMTTREVTEFLIYKQFLRSSCSSNKKINEKNNA